MTQQQAFLSWLKDAHAMEVGAIPTLQSHAAAAADYPEVQAKLSEHAKVTQHHAELIAGCLERYSAQPSALKEAVGGVMGKVTGLANLPAKDTIIKNALGDYAAESFEIICYQSLITAAKQLGDHDTVSVCQKILQDEEDMAAWLEAHIAPLTQTYLYDHTDRDETGSPTLSAKVKESVSELSEKGKDAAANVGARNVLLGAGALLAGAGAALLINQALKSGSEDDSATLPEQYASDPSETNGDESADSSVFEEESDDHSVEVDPDSIAVELNDVETFNHNDESAMMADLLDTNVAEDPGTATEVWLAPGPYTGMGPRAYDSAGDPLGQEAALRLTQHGQVDASNIEVTVNYGTVLLEGIVASDEMKRLAEEAIQSLEDVSEVQNSLQVPT